MPNKVLRVNIREAPCSLLTNGNLTFYQLTQPEVVVFFFAHLELASLIYGLVFITNTKIGGRELMGAAKHPFPYI